MYDPVDARGVPTSRGIPPLVRVLVVIGVIAVFVVGASTILTAGFGHYWPANKTLRVPLSTNGH